MAMSDITGLLRAAEGGDPQAQADLWSALYQELCCMAAQKMAREKPGQTLQASDLVHEAWLKLGGTGSWVNRSHFFSAAAEVMRRILIDRARRKQAMRHGGGREAIPADEVEIAVPETADEILQVDEALQKLEEVDPQKAELVKLKYFAGLTNEQAAETLGISEPTVKRYWAFARAWLLREISRQRQS